MPYGVRCYNERAPPSRARKREKDERNAWANGRRIEGGAKERPLRPARGPNQEVRGLEPKGTNNETRLYLGILAATFPAPGLRTPGLQGP